MKKKIKKILIAIGILLLLLAAAIGYAVYKDLKQEEVLKQEVLKLSNKDLLNDNFGIEIKTTGDYAYVENAIKKFYKELSDNVRILKYTLEDDNLINILSVDNLEKDRPHFLSSHQTITTVKTNTTKATNKIKQLCEEEYIKNLLDKDKVSDYYIDFYKKIMYTEQDLKTLAETKEEMEEFSNNLNLFLDKIEEILNMLEKNNSSWKIEDNQIYFQTNEQVDEYNKLYKELKDIAAEKLNSNNYSNTKTQDANM